MNDKRTLRERILAADDIETRMVEVPEWGVTVEMKTPTVRARSAILAEYVRDGKIDYERMYPSLLMSTVRDPETHELIFTRDDLPLLAQKASKPVERLAQVALDLSGMSLGTTAAERVEAGKADSIEAPSTPTSSPSPND